MPSFRSTLASLWFRLASLAIVAIVFAYAVFLSSLRANRHRQAGGHADREADLLQDVTSGQVIGHVVSPDAYSSG